MEAQREICAVYGDLVISYDTCERWFARIRYGNQRYGFTAIQFNERNQESIE